MALDVLEQIPGIDKKTHVVFMVTCDGEGLSHSDGIMSIESLSEQDLKIRGWFSGKLISNLESNPKVSLIIWNIQEHRGYQLKGICTRKMQIAFLDGFLQGNEADMPQIEWELMVRVDMKAGLCRQM